MMGISGDRPATIQQYTRADTHKMPTTPSHKLRSRFRVTACETDGADFTSIAGINELLTKKSVMEELTRCSSQIGNLGLHILRMR